MNKPLTILLFLLFLLSNLVMPYANFDDIQSLKIVYSTCLQQDADMDVLEFVGEKLLSAGFGFDEDKDESKPLHQPHRASSTAIIQIQNGGWLQQPIQFVEQPFYTSYSIIYPNLPNHFTPQNIPLSVFHPPAFVV